MKIQKQLWLLAALILCSVTAGTAQTSLRTDINPALLYWQAFAVMPDLSSDDQKHLFETEWRNVPMDDRAGELALRYDQTFLLIRQAVASRVPCDWGVDLSRGPEVLLPQLAKAKRCVQAAALRSRWFVQNDQQEAAQEDLVAAYVLGRNLSRDDVLISALVQIAIESIISGQIVQQWPVLDSDTIGSILTGIDRAPARGTMATCMRTEKVAFHDWLARRIEEFRSAHPADDDMAVQKIAELIAGIFWEGHESRDAIVAAVIKDAGGSSAGLASYVRQMEPFYKELERVMVLPYEEFELAINELNKRVTEHPNLLLKEFLPAVMKVRLKEFRITARLAMLRAGYQHRIDPVNGRAQVKDPFGSGPFEFSRFTVDGTDRGFRLRSQLEMDDFDEVLYFAESSGPAFYIDGPKAGAKVP